MAHWFANFDDAKELLDTIAGNDSIPTSDRRQVTTSPCPDPAAYDFTRNDRLLINIPSGYDRITPSGVTTLTTLRLADVKIPALAFSFFPKDAVKKKYPLIGSPGVTFVQLSTNDRSSLDDLTDELLSDIEDLHPLTDAQVKEVVKKFILPRKWEKTDHDIRGALDIDQNLTFELSQALGEMLAEIRKYAPEEAAAVEKIEQLANTSNKQPQRRAVSKTLSESLKEVTDRLLGRRREDTATSLLAAKLLKNRKLPPKGFSRVLVADDEERLRYPHQLRSEYNYTVSSYVHNLQDAKRRLGDNNHDVVLADLYFPELDDGKMFVLAARDSGENVVLVVSMASPFKEDREEISGPNVYFCSSSKTAAKIHAAICEIAADRGITESEQIPTASDPELLARQRIDDIDLVFDENYDDWNQLLPVAISQAYFMCIGLLRRHSRTATFEEKQVTDGLIDLLSSFATEPPRTLLKGMLFAQKLRFLHGDFRLLPESEFIADIDAALHGVVKQAVTVPAETEENIATLIDVLDSLGSLPTYATLAKLLQKILGKNWGNKQVMEILTKINSHIVSPLLDSLPASSVLDPITASGRDREKVTVILVEDTEKWRRAARRAVRQVQSELSDYFEFNDLLVCKNRAEAEKQIEARKVGSRTIVLLDLYLPQDPEHEKKIQKFGKTGRGVSLPDITNGLKLAERLRSYRYNHKVIICTDVDGLANRRKLFQLGIDEGSYISKNLGANNAVRLVAYHLTNALLETEIKNIREMEVFEPGESVGSSAWELDGVRLRLTSNDSRLLISMLDGPKSPLELSAEYKQPETTIQNQVSRLRESIFEQLRAAGIYCDVFRFIETLGSPTRFSLNARLDRGERHSPSPPSVVLISEEDSDLANKIGECFSELGLQVTRCGSDELDFELVKSATSGSPVLCFVGDDLNAVLAQHMEISSAIDEDFGRIFVFSSGYDDDNSRTLISKAIIRGAKLNNFIDLEESAKIGFQDRWRNLSAQRIFEEFERLTYGQPPRPSTTYGAPIIEVMNGSNLEIGKLNLRFDGSYQTLNSSKIGKFFAYLLSNPRRPIPYGSIYYYVYNSQLPASKRVEWPKTSRKKLRDLFRGTEESPGWAGTTMTRHRASEISKTIFEEIDSNHIQLNALVVDQTDERLLSKLGH